MNRKLSSKTIEVEDIDSAYFALKQSLIRVGKDLLKVQKSINLVFSLLHFLALNDYCSLNANEWPFILEEQRSKKKSKLVAKGDISHAHCNRVKQTAYRVKHTNKNYEKEIIVLWLFWFLSKIVNPKVFFVF